MSYTNIYFRPRLPYYCSNIDINATINLNDKVLKIIIYHKFNDILDKNKWSDIYVYSQNNVNVYVDSLLNRILNKLLVLLSYGIQQAQQITNK